MAGSSRSFGLIMFSVFLKQVHVVTAREQRSRSLAVYAANGSEAKGI